MKKRLHLSLLALIGSVILFVIASFAWLEVSRFVDMGIFSASVSKISIDSKIFFSPDDINYTETEAIDIRGAVPGDMRYYQIEITNTQSFPIEVNVYLSGFYSIYLGPGSEPNSLTLYDVLELNSFVDDTEVIPNNSLGDILADEPSLPDASISISGDFVVQPGEKRTVYLIFSIDGSVGNEYFYKGITINNILIQFEQSGAGS